MCEYVCACVRACVRACVCVTNMVHLCASIDQCNITFHSLNLNLVLKVSACVYKSEVHAHTYACVFMCLCLHLYV